MDDGSFEEVATGHNGDIKLSVTFKDNKIEKIDVVESSETPTIADTGFKEIINRILEHQNL
ncbi:FMN-binding protein [Anaerococcus lactolyticus]|uniref:FMN-binding protein n=1 Tax=Anaerococcus lactolyticus TaxID=33032 RepID=UPI003C6C635D